AGNKFLYEISQSLLQFRKDSDILARTGGDEFMLITDRYDESNVKELATDILSVLSEGFCLNEITFPTSGSIGIAFYPESGTSIGTLMKNSDTALNKAKQLGRNQYVIYSVEMQDEIVNQMELEEGLKKALANDEFVLYYQPQYNADTGKLYGFEALIRWNHPQRGLLSPYYFVPLAEETGLIVPIGRWVVKEAMGFVKRLNELGYGDLTVSVNASVKQLVEDDFAQTVLEMAKEMQVDPSNIKIEITESLLLDNQQGNNISKIEAINNNGFGVALDDFGTGYSSLTYLQQLPISVLKIDKSFVDYILQKQDEANICYHIIQLAHSINLKVVAEGVESKEQYVWLRDKECDFIQGYVASKPLDGQVILETIENILNYNVDAEG
ncbi:MAG: bifunctional diguanylate cyclase/phosphodiesterase, partial [Lachnospiraceae bacterium]|nr:bifunctional diguanylate cyclase/phosphodiesterase [Lachnospiraceae bacterium]